MSAIVFSILIPIIGFWEHAEDYAQKFLPPDCYKVHSYPERITTFYWFLPQNETNLKDYDQFVKISKEIASKYFREVNVAERLSYSVFNSMVSKTTINLQKPLASFNEATNIDHAVIEIEEFCPAGSGKKYILFSFTTEYDVIYPYYSGREFEDLFIRIPIKHKGKLNAIRPKDRAI